MTTTGAAVLQDLSVGQLIAPGSPDRDLPVVVLMRARAQRAGRPEAV
ncbi:MAG: hypothetical protein ABI903_08380 [Actinomycetota bacterium]